MESIYVLSDPDSVVSSKYKVGITTRNSKYLLRDYRRSRPEVKLYLFETCCNSREIETKILEEFNQYRVPHASGKLSEWIQIDLKVLINYIEPLLYKDKNVVSANVVSIKESVKIVNTSLVDFIKNDCTLSWYSGESCKSLYDTYLSTMPENTQKLKFLNFCKQLLTNISLYHKVDKNQIKYVENGTTYYRGIYLKKNGYWISNPSCNIL